MNAISAPHAASFSFEIQFKQDGIPMNIAELTPTWEARNLDRVITKTPIVIDAAVGLCRIYFTPADASQVSVNEVLEWRAALTQGSFVHVAMEGQIAFTKAGN